MGQENQIEIAFRKLDSSATVPRRAHSGDAAYDICAVEGAEIAPGSRVSIGTGLAVAIPDGYAGLILPRSGLAIKHGITMINSPGLIDSGFRGELRVLIVNSDRSGGFTVSPGDRIAQLLITPVSEANFVESEGLDGSERGEDGFGSSGI